VLPGGGGERVWRELAVRAVVRHGTVSPRDADGHPITTRDDSLLGSDSDPDGVGNGESDDLVLECDLRDGNRERVVGQLHGA